MSHRAGSAPSARRIGLANASPTIDVELFRAFLDRVEQLYDVEAAADHDVTLPPDHRLLIASNSPATCISSAADRLRGPSDDPLARGDEILVGWEARPVRCVEGTEQVGLMPHRTLGRPGGAAGVEQQQVVAAAPPRCHDAARDRRFRCLVWHGPVTGTVRGTIDPQPQPDLRRARAQLVAPPGERTVEHDGDDVGVVPQVGEFVGRVPVVGIDRRQAGLERGEGRPEVLRRVVAALGDLVLLGDAIGPGGRTRPTPSCGPPAAGHRHRADGRRSLSQTSAKFQYVTSATVAPPPAPTLGLRQPEPRSLVAGG